MTGVRSFAIGGAAAAAAVTTVFMLVAGGLSEDAAGEPADGGCAVPIGGDTGEGGGGAGSQEFAELNAEQMSIARTIAGVGKGMRIDERGVAIALATAMQESTLDPSAISPGGRSLGLFQQQGELYAGVTRDDPVDSSRAFYEMLKQRVPDYSSPDVSIDEAAQEVQRSGAGAHWYARWEQWSLDLAGQLYHGTDSIDAGDDGETGVTCSPGGGITGEVPVELNGTTVVLPSEGIRVRAPNEQAAQSIAAALSYLGTPYAWGGGSPTGPSDGIRDGGVADAHGDYAKTGFDCAGLTQYAYAQAGITLTRPASTQLTNARHTHDFQEAQPGDLLFWGSSPHHVAIYLGEHGGQQLMVEAPQSGDVVKVSPVRTGGDFQQQVVRPA